MKESVDNSQLQDASESCLHCIHGVDVATPEVIIIFIHGLDGHWEKTWSAQSGVAAWPKWLGEGLEQKGIRNKVFSFGYRLKKVSFKDNLALDERAIDLRDHLEDVDAIPLNTRLFFISHSYGGLVTKMLMNKEDLQTSSTLNILERTKGMMFLGTPHLGSKMPSWLSFIEKTLIIVVSKFLVLFSSFKTQTFDELEERNGLLKMLKERFIKLAISKNWSIHQYYEGYTTYGLKIVDSTSADSGIGGVSPTDKNHISLPKLSSTNSKIYKKAMTMITEASRENLIRMPGTTDDKPPSNKDEIFTLFRSAYKRLKEKKHE